MITASILLLAVVVFVVGCVLANLLNRIASRIDYVADVMREGRAGPAMPPDASGSETISGRVH